MTSPTHSTRDWASASTRGSRSVSDMPVPLRDHDLSMSISGSAGLRAASMPAKSTSSSAGGTSFEKITESAFARVQRDYRSIAIGQWQLHSQDLGSLDLLDTRTICRIPAKQFQPRLIAVFGNADRRLTFALANSVFNRHPQHLLGIADAHAFIG